MTPSTKFGHLLRVVRKSRKLKVWQLAERANVEAKHLGRIERGEKKPSFDLIIALAQSLGVSPSRFFEFDTEITDRRALRRKLDQLLDERDPQSLQKAVKMLAIMLDS